MLAFSLDRTHKAVGHIVMQHFPQITAPQGPASWLLYAVTCSSAALLLHIVVERSFLCRRDRVTRHKPASALEDEMPGARAVIARMDALVPKSCEKRGGQKLRSGKDEYICVDLSSQPNFSSRSCCGPYIPGSPVSFKVPGGPWPPSSFVAVA
jgi:hypothetical protein